MIGIYKITNKINGKVYIGQSIDIEERFQKHKQHEYNIHLALAYKDYGLQNFSFEVIKEIKNSPLANLFLNVYEVKYINEYNSTNKNKGYNITKGGSDCPGIPGTSVVCTETGEVFEKIIHARHLADPRAIRKVLNGNQVTAGGYHWKKIKKEYHNHYKVTNRSFGKRIQCIESGKIYENCRSIKLGIHPTGIYKAAKGIQESAGGFHWRFVEEIQ